MEIFTTLEERVEKLISAYREQQTRVAALQDELQGYKEGATRLIELEARLAALEAERTALRERLERVIALLGSIEM